MMMTTMNDALRMKETTRSMMPTVVMSTMTMLKMLIRRLVVVVEHDDMELEVVVPFACVGQYVVETHNMCPVIEQ